MSSDILKIVGIICFIVIVNIITIKFYGHKIAKRIKDNPKKHIKLCVITTMIALAFFVAIGLLTPNIL